jgi:hypothetical protein
LHRLSNISPISGCRKSSFPLRGIPARSRQHTLGPWWLQIGDTAGSRHPQTAMVPMDWSVSRPHPQQRPRRNDGADVALTGCDHQARSPANLMAATRTSYRISRNLQA